MKSLPSLVTPERLAEKIIASGIHLDLTPALRRAIAGKLGRLLRHEPRIVRIRLNLEHDQTSRPDQAFVAKGHIEIGGPDVIASANSDDAYKSIDLLVDKLDSALRRRAGKKTNPRNDPRNQRAKDSVEDLAQA